MHLSPELVDRTDRVEHSPTARQELAAGDIDHSTSDQPAVAGGDFAAVGPASQHKH